MKTLICPNCGASASLPFEMTCGDHHPVMVEADDRLITADDGTVSPAPCFRWCPDCDGQGEVTRMDSSPNLDEYTEPCPSCDDGIVADLA